MPSPATFPTYDRIVPGGLESFLREARLEHAESLRTIVARLSDEHSVTVSVETVRRWCRALEIPTERVA